MKKQGNLFQIKKSFWLKVQQDSLNGIPVCIRLRQRILNHGCREKKRKRNRRLTIQKFFNRDPNNQWSSIILAHPLFVMHMLTLNIIIQKLFKVGKKHLWRKIMKNHLRVKMNTVKKLPQLQYHKNTNKMKMIKMKWKTITSKINN